MNPVKPATIIPNIDLISNKFIFFQKQQPFENLAPTHLFLIVLCLFYQSPSLDLIFHHQTLLKLHALESMYYQFYMKLQLSYSILQNHEQILEEQKLLFIV